MHTAKRFIFNENVPYTMNLRTFDIQYLGKREYLWTWNYQRSLFEKRLRGMIPDTLLFVEHYPVYTIGKTGSEAHILQMADCKTDSTVPVIHIDRGGDITYHGPGQLVGYPIMNLADHSMDLHRYLRDIEEVIIRTLSDYGISAGREEGLTGVWVEGSKIAAIGVKVTRWITMHGFALNVSTDLRYFERIVPCGIKGCRITSMQNILCKNLAVHDVAYMLIKHFQNIFCVQYIGEKDSFPAILE